MAGFLDDIISAVNDLKGSFDEIKTSVTNTISETTRSVTEEPTDKEDE
jgi:hypothetical protein